MISLYSVPAAIAFLAKIVILYSSHRAVLQGARASIFRIAVAGFMALNVAEFVALQFFSYAITFNSVVAYYTISAFAVPLLVHLAISISFDDWNHSRFNPVYVALYGFGIVLAVLFAFFTPLLMYGVEDMRGYTVTTRTGPYYWLYQIFLVSYFGAMLALPLYGARKGRDEARRNQCKLWLAASAPVVILVLTVVALLQLNVKWINATVTLPLLLTVALASIGYVVHKRPIIELEFYIPGTAARKRKAQFYRQLRDLGQEACRIDSLSELLDRIASILRCPVVLVTNSGHSIRSADALENLIALPPAALSEVDRLTSRDDVASSSPAMRRLLTENAIEAVIPFFRETRSLSFWLLCGEPFSKQIYSARDYKVFRGLVKEISGLLLEKMIELNAAHSGDSRLSATGPIADNAMPVSNELTAKTLQERIEELEAICIRAALAQTKGNKAQAARLLGLKPNTLHYKIVRYRLKDASLYPHKP